MTEDACERDPGERGLRVVLASRYISLEGGDRDNDG